MTKYAGVASTTHTLSIAAMEEASRFGQRIADIDHLLLALVISEQPAGQVLRNIGITLQATRDAVEEQHSAQLATLGVSTGASSQGPIVFHKTGGYEWSERALGVFARANKGRKLGDAAAVLRELVSEPSGMIEQILQRLDSSPTEVISRLDEAQRYLRNPPARPHRYSGLVAAFVPAPVEEVWELLADPLRMPEWEPSTRDVTLHHVQSGTRIGDSWTAHPRTEHPDGKPLPTKTKRLVRNVELLAHEDRTLIEWRHTYPQLAGANSKRIRVEMEPAAAGTQLRTTLTLEHNPSRPRSPIRAFLMRSYVRFAIWMQLSNLSGSISRVFRC